MSSFYVFVISIYTVGSQLFSAGSPDGKYYFGSYHGYCGEGSKLFSAGSPGANERVSFFFTIWHAGWKLAL